MRHPLLLSVFTAVIALTAFAFGDELPPLEVRSVGALLVKAVESGDQTALEKLLAKDYVAIDIHGNAIDKKEWLQQLSESGLSFDSVDTTQQSVRAYGDTAITTGVYTVKGKVNGQAIDGQYRYLDVWVKRTGQWQAIATSMTPVLSTQPPAAVAPGN